MAEINLAPQDKTASVVKRRQLGVFALSFVLIVVVLIVWGVMFASLDSARNEMTEVERQLQAVETEISALQEEASRVESFGGRLEVAQDLLESRNEWTKTLSSIEQLSVPGLTLDSLSVEAARDEIRLSGVVGTLDEVARAAASFASSSERVTPFSEAVVENITRQEVKNEEGAVTDTNFSFSMFLKNTQQ